MSHDTWEIQRFLRERGILICFSGKLSQELIEEYGEAVKKYMEAEDRPANEIINIFSIFIEQTQNIKNYCSSKSQHKHFEEMNQSCIISIGKTDKGFYISAGNLVLAEDIGHLVGKIEMLGSLDKTDLKKMYKQKLREELQEDQGAGIGLIEIARKASEPLEFSVSPVNDELTFFTLKAVV